MKIITFFLVVFLFLILGIIVGEKLRDIFPDSKFSKWWNDNVVSNRHDEDI